MDMALSYEKNCLKLDIDDINRIIRAAKGPKVGRSFTSITKATAALNNAGVKPNWARIRRISQGRPGPALKQLKRNLTEVEAVLLDLVTKNKLVLPGSDQDSDREMTSTDEQPSEGDEQSGSSAPLLSEMIVLNQNYDLESTTTFRRPPKGKQQSTDVGIVSSDGGHRASLPPPENSESIKRCKAIIQVHDCRIDPPSVSEIYDSFTVVAGEWGPCIDSHELAGVITRQLKLVGSSCDVVWGYPRCPGWEVLIIEFRSNSTARFGPDKTLALAEKEGSDDEWIHVYLRSPLERSLVAARPMDDFKKSSELQMDFKVAEPVHDHPVSDHSLPSYPTLVNTTARHTGTAYTSSPSDQFSRTLSPSTRTTSDPRPASRGDSLSQTLERHDGSHRLLRRYGSPHGLVGHAETAHNSPKLHSPQIPPHYARSTSQLSQAGDGAALEKPPQSPDTSYPPSGQRMPPPFPAGTAHNTLDGDSSEGTTTPQGLGLRLPPPWSPGPFLAPPSKPKAVDTSSDHQVSRSTQSYPDDSYIDDPMVQTGITSAPSRQTSQLEYGQLRNTSNSSITPYDMTFGHDTSSLMSSGYVGQESYDPGLYPGTFHNFLQADATSRMQGHATQYNTSFTPQEYPYQNMEFSRTKDPQPSSAVFELRPQSRQPPPFGGQEQAGPHMSYESSPSTHDASSLAPTPRSSGGGSSLDDDARSSVHGSCMSSRGRSTPNTPGQNGHRGRTSTARTIVKQTCKDPFHAYKVDMLVSSRSHERPIASMRDDSGRGKTSPRLLIEWCETVNSLFDMYGIKGGLNPLPPGSNGIMSPPGTNPSRMLSVTQNDIAELVIRSTSWLKKALRGWKNLNSPLIMSNPEHQTIKNIFERHRRKALVIGEDETPKTGIGLLEEMKGV